MRVKLRFKKLIVKLLKVLLVMVALIAFTATFLYFLEFFTVNNNRKEFNRGVQIQMLNNGAHTDLILPYRSKVFSWDSIFYPSAFSDNKNVEYLTLGWGEKDFYINTPTWADLEISTAAKALLWPTEGAFHVVAHSYMPRYKQSHFLKVSSQEYLKLCQSISKHVSKKNEKAVLIPEVGYTDRRDAFFKANNHYHLFNTCNTYANDILKEAGLPACLHATYIYGPNRLYPPN